MLWLLEADGIGFAVYDPHVRDFPYELSPLQETLSDADCIVILTDHDEFKFLNPLEVSKLVRHRTVFDTKNLLDRELWRQSGFQVYRLGCGG